MKNKKTGNYFKVYKNMNGEGYFCEIGSEWDANRIIIDYCNIITMRNELNKIIEREEQNEKNKD